MRPDYRIDQAFDALVGFLEKAADIYGRGVELVFTGRRKSITWVSFSTLSFFLGLFLESQLSWGERIWKDMYGVGFICLSSFLWFNALHSLMMYEKEKRKELG